MKPYHKYMLFYTSLQLVGIGAIIKLSEWEKLQRQEYQIQAKQIEKINK